MNKKKTYKRYNKHLKKKSKRGGNKDDKGFWKTLKKKQWDKQSKRGKFARVAGISSLVALAGFKYGREDKSLSDEEKQLSDEEIKHNEITDFFYKLGLTDDNKRKNIDAYVKIIENYKQTDRLAHQRLRDWVIIVNMNEKYYTYSNSNRSFNKNPYEDVISWYNGNNRNKPLTIFKNFFS
jgi:hypothetical protein